MNTQVSAYIFNNSQEIIHTKNICNYEQTIKLITVVHIVYYVPGLYLQSFKLK